MNWLLISLFVAFAPPNGSDRKAAIEKVNQAIQHEAKEDHGGALRVINEAIALDPTYSPAYYTRGQIQMRQGKLADARSTFEKGLEVVSAEHPLRKARMAYHLGTAIEAIATAEGTSQAAREKGLDEAIVAFERAVEANPKAYKAFYRLGAIQDQLNRPTEADANLRNCIVVNPRFSACFVRLGTMYADYGHANVGMAVLEVGLKANDTDAAMYLGAGRVHLDLGRADDAVGMLKKAKAIDPDMPEILFYLGIAYAEKRDRKSAVENLQAFLHKAGNDIPEMQKRVANDTIARMQDVI